ncbi:MAG: hypothetical protein M0R77_00955 [Gammaproteobacteria bacterium]|nr:hypothetical protein [Acholeplasmataceae bacterium]MCK9529124.1 hypothetical protein [Gammaproteobacteria bacterium]
MSAITLKARKLLGVPTEVLWETLNGEFYLEFDDGVILADEASTIYSSYIWKFISKFPDIPFLKKHHINSHLGKSLLSVEANGRLFDSVLWDVFDWAVYGVDPRNEDLKSRVPDPSTAKLNVLEFKEELAETAWGTLNEMYNDLSVRCEPWVVGISINDLVEVTQHNPIKEVLEGFLPPVQESLDKIYDTLDEALFNDPKLENNILSRLVRSGLINKNQLQQCVGARGFITDIDSSLFRLPILRNLTQGIRSAYDSQIESRSAAKSQAYSEEPLEQSEYFSRRQQLISQTLKNLVEGDCGAKEGLGWNVGEDDLKHLVGKNYYDDEGVLRYIKSSDKHLIGKTITLRSPFKCQTTHPTGICSTCMGQLALSVFRLSNVGQDTAVSMLSDVGQRVLSVKHLDGSSVVDSLTVDLETRKYIRVGKDGSSYYLSPDLKNASSIELVFSPYTVPGFTDIKQCKDTSDLFLSRVSRMNSLGMIVKERNRVIEVALDVGLAKRKASLAFDVINLIKERGWKVVQTEAGDTVYVVDITGLDQNTKLLTVPLRHFNMGDQAKAIAALLESKTGAVKERDEDTPISEFIAELYETVNSRLSVNFAVLEVITYSIMIVSAKGEDYSLPKPWTQSGLGVKDRTFRRRSASVEMAYQGQQFAIKDPVRYNYTNVMDHQMDVFIDPQSVVEREAKMEKNNQR